MSGTLGEMVARALQQRKPKQDFTGRLPPVAPYTDPNMAVPPVADPGYAMPNSPIENLNQAQGQAVGGTLPISMQDYVRQYLQRQQQQT